MENKVEEPKIIKANDNDELLREFIGKNYDKISTRQFNIAGFFFTMFYMFYRKMFLYGFLCVLLELGLSLVFKNFYFGLIINILVGLFINKVYLIHANKKINKIKDENPNKSVDEIKKICKDKGGTSVLYLFIGILLESLIISLIILIMLPLGLFKGMTDLFNNGNIQINNNGDTTDIIIDDNEENYGNDVYNGMLYFNSEVKVKDKFSITVPNKFTDNSYDSSYNYSYSVEARENGGIFTSCNISLNVVDGFSSSNILIQGIHDFNKDYIRTDVANINVNNTIWTWTMVENDIGKQYYYGTDKDNKVFLLQYEVQADTDSDCETYRESIINSIQSK